MAFAQDLLDQAYHLANLESGDPKQSSLRRAVSTAYPRQNIRSRKMKLISADRIRSLYNSGQPPSGARLKNVAQAFVQLQEQRHTADYDSAFVWSRDDAAAVIDTARAAFSSSHTSTKNRPSPLSPAFPTTYSPAPPAAHPVPTRPNANLNLEEPTQPRPQIAVSPRRPLAPS